VSVPIFLKGFSLQKLFFLFLMLAAQSAAVFAADETVVWLERRAQHFIIYYQDVSAGYLSELISSAEKYYESIIEDLGYRRFDFWSWDNRAKIYLYPDYARYIADTKSNSWSGALVDVQSRVIKTFVGQKEFFSSILPHEMAHIIFFEFTGRRTDLPLWLAEGAACSQEKSFLNARLDIARGLIKQGKYIPFKNLSEIKDYSADDFGNFYAQSASVIVFLQKRFGRDKFLDFSRRLSDGIPWQDALANVYRFKDIGDMEEKWKEFFAPGS